MTITTRAGRNILICNAVATAIAVAAALAPTAGLAADADAGQPAESSGLQEIVVTDRKSVV